MGEYWAAAPITVIENSRQDFAIWVVPAHNGRAESSVTGILKNRIGLVKWGPVSSDRIIK
jgi:hypothetical protein